jgi:hypothetical protein
MSVYDDINFETHLRFKKCPKCGGQLQYDIRFLPDFINSGNFSVFVLLTCKNFGVQVPRGCGHQIPIEGGSVSDFMARLESAYQEQLALRLMEK